MTTPVDTQDNGVDAGLKQASDVIDPPRRPEQGEKPSVKFSGSSPDDYASFDQLLSKPAREKDVTIGELKVHLRAIGNVEYDQLVASCPPDQDGRDRGLIYDQEKFAPKLIAAVVSRPKMDLDQATRLWKDPNWAGGEIGGLYKACVDLCQRGLDVPFIGGG